MLDLTCIVCVLRPFRLADQWSVQQLSDIIIMQLMGYDSKHKIWKSTSSIWMFPKNSGTPKSAILIGFSIINHPFWDTPYFWKHPYKYVVVLIRLQERMASAEESMKEIDEVESHELTQFAYTLSVI